MARPRVHRAQRRRVRYQAPWFYQPYERFPRGNTVLNQVEIAFLRCTPAGDTAPMQVPNPGFEYDTTNPPPWKTEVIDAIHTTAGQPCAQAFWSNVGIFGLYSLYLTLQFLNNLTTDEWIIWPANQQQVRGPLGEMIAPGLVMRQPAGTLWPPPDGDLGPIGP